MALLDLQNTSAYLAYLGYNFLENDTQKSAVHSEYIIIMCFVNNYLDYDTAEYYSSIMI